MLTIVTPTGQIGSALVRRLLDAQANLRLIARNPEKPIVKEALEKGGIDGCGVLTFGLTLERAAQTFARLPALDAGDRVIAAMRANPDLLRGPVALDVQLIRSVPGWVAKGGAEGLLCAASPDGVGICLKVVDGSFRALAPAAAHVFARLGVDAGGLGGLEVTNARGERVGELRVVR